MPLGFTVTVALYLVFAVASVWLVVVDLREKRLPNDLVGWSSGIVAVLLMAVALAGDGGSRVGLAFASATVYGVVFLVLFLGLPQGIGAGDVKLAPMIGAMAGLHGVWAAALWTPIVIAVLGGVTGAAALVRRRKDFAFGPVLIGSVWLVIGAHVIGDL